MDSPEEFEGYLVRSGLEYEMMGEGLYVLHNDKDHIDNVVVQFSPPVVVFSVRLMDAPTKPAARGALFERLLELNAAEMVSGAYGLDDGGIVITDTLQAANLDYNEFQAAVDSLTLAITEHYPELKKYHHGPEGEAAA
jgi:hypothetical protein